MKRYFIFLSYQGTDYYGWQIQKQGNTVQGTLQKVLSLKLGENISVIGAGRTDTGVHARNYVAHFDTSKNLNADILYQINNFLPDDIVIHKIAEVKNDAHARFDAVSRTYKYYICLEKNPFERNFCLLFRQKLNIEKMNQACEILKKHEDFTSFSKLHTDVKTNNCKIFYAKWDKTDKKLVFTITANRFLRNMVRAIVGTMLDVGTDKISINNFEKIILAKNRDLAGHSAKAKGLFLEEIVYPNDIFK